MDGNWEGVMAHKQSFALLFLAAVDIAVLTLSHSAWSPMETRILSKELMSRKFCVLRRIGHIISA